MCRRMQTKLSPVPSLRRGSTTYVSLSSISKIFHRISCVSSGTCAAFFLCCCESFLVTGSLHYFLLSITFVIIVISFTQLSIGFNNPIRIKALSHLTPFFLAIYLFFCLSFCLSVCPSICKVFFFSLSYLFLVNSSRYCEIRLVSQQLQRFPQRSFANKNGRRALIMHANGAALGPLAYVAPGDY